MTSTKIEWVPAVSSYVIMPASYGADAITAEDVQCDDALEIISSDAVVLTTPRGAVVGTITQICRWQARHPGAMATIEACGIAVDVSDVEWGEDGAEDAVALRIARELDGVRVVSAPHVRGEDADAGVVTAIDGSLTVMVEWDSRRRPQARALSLPAHALSLRVETFVYARRG